MQVTDAMRIKGKIENYGTSPGQKDLLAPLPEEFADRKLAAMPISMSFGESAA